MIRALYARVSSEEQAREGLSINAQLAQMRAWCAQRGEPTVEYVDAGVSAHTDKVEARPAFKRMLDDAAAGKFQGVLVTHGDRFARDILVAEFAFRELLRQGVEYVELDNPSGDNLIRRIKSAINQDYSDQLSRKIKRGLVQRASQGLHVGSLPFGYCNGRCSDCKAERTCPRWDSVPLKAPPILHPEDWHGVKMAFEAYRAGTHSDATIADLLNRCGYRSRTRRGRDLWSKYGVDWLLTNATYTGRIVVNGIDFEGKHPAIIAPDLFAEVQRVRARHRGKPSTYAPKHRVYLFNGLMECAGCGQLMRAIPYGSNRLRGYVCRSQERKRGDCMRSQGFVRADGLEAQFGALLAGFALPDDWQAQIMLAVAATVPGQVDVEAERRRIEGRLERIKVLFEEGDKPLADYRRERDSLRAQLGGLVVAPPAASIDAGHYLQSLGIVWAAATMAERREIVMNLLARIVCDPDRKRLVAFTPKPVFAPFFRHQPGLRELAGGAFEFVSET